MGWSNIPFGSGFDLPSTSQLEKRLQYDNNDNDENDDERQHLNVSYLNAYAYVRWMCM